MKTNKLTALVLSALMVFMAVPIAFAENSITTANVVTPVDQSEVTAMNNQHGAKMRVEQLEKRMQFNLDKGSKVIDKLLEKN